MGGAHRGHCTGNPAAQNPSSGPLSSAKAPFSESAKATERLFSANSVFEEFELVYANGIYMAVKD
jgi:hypothetical protein